MTKVLVGLSGAFGADWRGNIETIKKFSLKEIALFLTGLDTIEREECLNRLSEINDLHIPFVHAMHDMKRDEYEYIIKNFHTELFNTHSLGEFPRDPDLYLFMDKMLLENTLDFIDSDEIKIFKGICLDFSHLEDDRLCHKEHFEFVEKCIEKYPVFANHSSAITALPYLGDGRMRHDIHTFKDLSEFDFLSRYTPEHFGKYLAIEVSNSIEEQLEAKKYVEKLLADKGILD